MKIALIATIITIAIIALFGIATAEEYPATAIVTEIDYTADTVTVETFTGFLYVFEGCEDWAEGDCVSLIMDDNATDIITDDMIIKAEYSAWMLIHW